MRHLVKGLMLAASLVAGGATASALPLGTGSYCSATTTDGNWAFGFNYVEPGIECAQVQQALYYRTPAPVAAYRQGYFWANAFNTVYAQCLNSSNVFSGYGITALQNAYNWANLVGGVQCLFTVN